MPKYIVQGDAHITHGAKGDKEATVYNAGDEIELTSAEAALLGELNVKPLEDKPTVGKLSAADAIAAIGECTTIDQVKEFFKGEERTTVTDAARAKIKMLKDAEKK